MIEIDIPGGDTLRVEHLVFDYNGTLAKDGVILSSVAQRFKRLADLVKIHVVTADTFGLAGEYLAGLPCELHILPVDNQVKRKKAFVESLGPARVAAFGNGRNDELMLQTAAVGVVLLGGEGTAVSTLQAGDVVCTDIGDALDFFIHTKRLIATLRT